MTDRLVKGRPSRRLRTRSYMVAGYAALALLVFVFGGWAVLTTIEGAVIAPGTVEVEARRQVVQHETGGVVGEIFVRDGDVVEAGDLLLRFDDSFAKSELATVENQLFSLLATKGRLQAELTGAEEISFDPELTARARINPDFSAMMEIQQNLLNARRDARAQQEDQFAKRRQQVLKENEGLRSRVEALNTQLALIEPELEKQQSLLDEKLIERGPLLVLQRDYAALNGDLAEAEAQIAANLGKISEIELATLNLTATARETATDALPEVEAQIAQYREKRNALMETLSRMDVRAPVSGVVLGMRINTLRAVVRPAESILNIVPQDGNLIVRARITPSNVDQIYAGQDAFIKLDAYGHRSAPEYEGTVGFISADILTDDRSGARYYEAQVDLGPALPGGPESVKIIPGMQAEVFFKTGVRTPMAFLVEPFMQFFFRAFRER